MVDTEKKILPEKGKNNVLITSALPYVNNIPHLGNIVGSVLSADVYSRYCKARGWPTLFICGSDEYGTATETKAIELNLTPEQLCSQYWKVHKDIYDWFSIEFDIFGRTSTEQHTKITQGIYRQLQANGMLTENADNIQPFCTHEVQGVKGTKKHGFLADRFVEGVCPKCQYNDARGDQCDKCGNLLDPLELGNPRCKLHGEGFIIQDKTRHMFLKLNELQPEIESWFKSSVETGKWSGNAIAITENWFKQVLEARAITRDLSWGVPVPLEDVPEQNANESEEAYNERITPILAFNKAYAEKVFYVWFDACIGYPSITANYTTEWEQWWKNPSEVKLYQFMGKDNVPFHAVVFPGSQIGTKDNWTRVHHLSATEYLNYEGGKFSKSRGIGVFGNNAQETGIPPDVWRYYLISHRPETGDTEFEWAKFIASNNNELLKNLGNLVNRIIKFLNSKVYNSIVPDYTAYTSPALTEHVNAANAILKQYNEELTAVKQRAALVTLLHFCDLGNKLLQENRLDNKLAESEPQKCAAVAGLALNHVHLLASLVEPFMPNTRKSILQQLNAEMLVIPDVWEAKSIRPGHKIGEAAYLFSQIKPEKEAEWRDLFGGEEAKKAKREEAEKRAAKAAQKKAKKEKKKAATDGAPKAEGAKEGGQSVETVEKGGPDAIASGKTGVEEVTEGLSQTVIPSS